MRAEIGAWLADRAATSPGRSLTGCRTIQGAGTVIICEGDCRRPGEMCDVKVTRRTGGGDEFHRVCQRPIMTATARTRSRRRVVRRISKK